MRNTKRIGDVSTAKIAAALLAKGYTVLYPFGDNERYDLVIENHNGFERVQCKTGRRTKSGNISFNTKSVSCNGKTVKDYKGQIEYFGVYYPLDDSCYLIPLDVTGTSETTLQLTQSNMARSTRLASDFKI